VLVGPLLVPVWVLGWWRLAREPALRTWRPFAVAYVLLSALFLLTGGKPYYLAGLYPVLLAAGAGPVVDWARRNAGRTRAVVAALVLSLAVNGVLMLPIVPVERLGDTPIADVNYDAGETVGWPRLAAAVEEVRADLPAGERVAVLAANYGEAGAVDRFAPALGPAHSGHNSYGTWGPPPEDATTVIVIGYPEQRLARWFGSLELSARVDNGVDLDNDEQGAPIWVATQRRAPWSEIWPELRRLG